MMATRTPGGVDVELDDQDVRILTGLLDEMTLLLEADIPKADPVVARLFPQAYQDPDEQKAYEELTADALRQTKLHAVKDLRERIGGRGPRTLELNDEGVGGVLALLTDIRLAIGTRLEVDEERMGADIDPRDPDAAAWSVLHWLGWVQGSILEAMGY